MHLPVVTEQPADDVLCYATTKRMWTDDGPVSVDGWVIFPEDWASSMYWSVDVLSNVIVSGQFDAETAETVDTGLKEFQQTVIDGFYGDDGMLATVKASETPAETATECSRILQELALITVDSFTAAAAVGAAAAE